MKKAKYGSRNKKSSTTARRRNLSVILLLIVAAIIVGTLLYRRHSPAEVSNTSSTKSATSSTQYSSASGKSQSGTALPVNPIGTSKTPTTPPATSTGSTPKAPYDGVFVSSHTIGLNQSEESVCNTSIGASCDITFTSNGKSIDLGAAAADSSGSVYWMWTPQQKGLTPGSWVISATATNGSQSATTTDPTPLQVTQ